MYCGTSCIVQPSEDIQWDQAQLWVCCMTTTPLPSRYFLHLLPTYQFPSFLSLPFMLWKKLSAGLVYLCTRIELPFTELYDPGCAQVPLSGKGCLVSHNPLCSSGFDYESFTDWLEIISQMCVSIRSPDLPTYAWLHLTWQMYLSDDIHSPGTISSSNVIPLPWLAPLNHFTILPYLLY